MSSAPEWFVRMVNSRLTDRPGPLDPRWNELRLVQRRPTEETATVVTALIERAIAQLRTEDELLGALLEAHVAEGLPVKEMKERFPYALSYRYKVRKRGRARVVEILWEEEQEERAAWQGQLVSYLPQPTYDRYIGGEQRIAEVRRLLFGEQGASIVAIEGAGGLGKTALAREIVRRLAEEEQAMGVGWVSAQQVVFTLSGEIVSAKRPALTEEQMVSDLVNQLDIKGATRLGLPQAKQALIKQLHTVPHLIVVDNLETCPDLDSLLPLLKQLAGRKSRFLLTTRESLLYDNAIRTWPLPALHLEEARALLLHYATSGVRAELEAAPQEVEAIFEVVGGNPLALRLVVGQCAHSSLSDILGSLSAATGRADRLYDYLFTALWERLEPAVRTVLLVMPLVCRTGATLAEIVEIHGTDEATVSAALEQLRLRNLVDRIGDLRQPRYTIHNLTNSFLLAQLERTA